MATTPINTTKICYAINKNKLGYLIISLVSRITHTLNYIETYVFVADAQHEVTPFEMDLDNSRPEDKQFKHTNKSQLIKL